MGNSLACFAPTQTPTKAKTTQKELIPPWLSPLSSLKKSRKLQSEEPDVVFEDSYIKKQAQIATMLYHQHLQNNGGHDHLIRQFERSVSTQNHPMNSYNKSKRMPARSRSLSCSTSVLPNQDVARSDGEQEQKHFVLVHGGGFGAWCWYKIIALLKQRKYDVDAIDLAGSGSNFCDINSIKTLAQYATPVTHFLSNLGHNKQVILVGHDVGGACISHAMEMYPHKVSKAIFVAATMLTHGQRPLDIFSQQSCLSDISRRAQKFIYAEGKDHHPTAIDFDKSLLDDFLFNRTPPKDIALASVSMRPVPFAPVTDKLSLSSQNYGSIARFYIKTDDDFAIPPSLQESMIQSSPANQVFDLKNSDHCPFLSRPQPLCRLLIQISNII
ncbi:Putative methylesterase 13- chloroplastic [Striga hermonthica]|uniref:Methylesterase 13- chloroplastic n=1 Tax=Striga hermonthica TaxID=68872 RepID=A0A9N7N8E3_STRHE|nr:Putative methylesterase 13- chloroplastic [Striga hermonthica]